MTMPTPGQLAAGTEAMRADASMWASAAADIAEAQQVAARLDLAATHFSYIGDRAGLTAIYRQIQAKLELLCGEASAAFGGFASQLMKAADDYDTDERHAVHRLHGTY